MSGARERSAINKRSSNALQNETEIKELQVYMQGLQEHTITLIAEATSQRNANNRQFQDAGWTNTDLEARRVDE